ncbi:MAG: hypothetical protein ACI4OS_03370 [Akkermansia sp.]
MAIRMKEWALVAYPGTELRVPTSGIEGMSRAAAQWGQGWVGAVTGGTELAAAVLGQEESAAKESADAALDEANRRVNTVGVVSKMQARLAEEMGAAGGSPEGDEPGDWQSVWQRSGAPVVAETAAVLPPKWRDAAGAMVQRASLLAKRRYELDSIANSRHRWQEVLESEVSRGEPQMALHQLELGRGVFVPEGQMEARRREVESRCCAARWTRALQEAPCEALRDWRREDAVRPGGAAQLEQVELAVSQARRGLQRALGQEWTQRLAEGGEPTPQELLRAEEAGVLEAPPAEGKPWSAQEYAAWQHRVDTREDGEAAADALRVEIAALRVPAPQRRALLGYLERSATLPPEHRRRVGEALWNVYLSGGLGCPEDAVPQQRLARLQQEAQQRLTAQSDEELHAWLLDCGSAASGWVCYETQQA